MAENQSHPVPDLSIHRPSALLQMDQQLSTSNYALEKRKYSDLSYQFLGNQNIKVETYSSQLVGGVGLSGPR